MINRRLPDAGPSMRQHSDGAADPTGQLHVLWHDRDSLGMDRAQVGVPEKVHDEVLGRLLERKQAFCRPPEGLRCQVISNFPTGQKEAF
jgi:hypothetical protein